MILVRLGCRSFLPFPNLSRTESLPHSSILFFFAFAPRIHCLLLDSGSSPAPVSSLLLLSCSLLLLGAWLISLLVSGVPILFSLLRLPLLDSPLTPASWASGAGACVDGRRLSAQTLLCSPSLSSSPCRLSLSMMFGSPPTDYARCFAAMGGGGIRRAASPLNLLPSVFTVFVPHPTISISSSLSFSLLRCFKSRVCDSLSSSSSPALPLILFSAMPASSLEWKCCSSLLLLSPV